MVCSDGFFIETQDILEDTDCKRCPTGGFCSQGLIVYPLEGYWRSNSTLNSFTKCPNTESSCLEGSYARRNSNCKEGYEGYLCGTCQVDYYQTRDFYCQPCFNMAYSVFRLILSLLICFAFIGFNVRSIIQSSVRYRPFFSVYFKMLVDHFQMMHAVNLINFSWPHYIDTFVYG